MKRRAVLIEESIISLIAILVYRMNDALIYSQLLFEATNSMSLYNHLFCLKRVQFWNLGLVLN